MVEKGATGAFAIGFALGTLIGVAVGFILAPQPGRETRMLVRDKVGDIPETARELTADRKKVYTETWSKHRGRHEISDTYFE